MKRDKLHLQRILKAINKIEDYLSNPRFTNIQQDDLFTDALSKQLEEIGEAANSISREIYTHHPELPQRDMADIRDFLVHQYEKSSRNIIFKTCKEDLPPLKKDIQNILSEFE